MPSGPPAATSNGVLRSDPGLSVADRLETPMVGDRRSSIFGGSYAGLMRSLDSVICGVILANAKKSALN
jgi:hypothetical protein